MFDNERQLIQQAKELSRLEDKKLTQKEAIKLLLSNPELLDPICYILVASETHILDIFSHKDYCLLMKKKAIQTNNKKMMKIVGENK